MTPDFSTQEEIFGKLLGPMPTSRAATNGLVLRHGYIVAEWGDTERADPTYSVAKSVLSTIAGHHPRPRPHQGYSRPRGQVRARRRLRLSPQPPHYLGAPRPPNQRVGRRAVGQKRRFYRPRSLWQGRAQAPRAAGPGHLLRIQRRAHQPLCPLAAAPVAKAAAGRVQAGSDGPHRRVEHLAVGALPQRRGHGERPGPCPP